MQKAIDDVRNGVCSVREAVKIHNVPRSTLRDKLAGRHMTLKGAQRRKFSDAEENYLADLLLSAADLGVPLGKPMLKKLVTPIAVEKGLTDAQAVFSDHWHRNFLKRHSTLRIRLSHSTNRKKAREWTAETCEEWLTWVGELHADGYLADPNGIFNLDESAFQIAEKIRLVYARRGTKEVLSYMDGTDRDLITVLACGNAAGKMLPPLILFDGKLHVASRFEGTDDRCYLAVNSSGVMDCPAFASYIRDVLIPSLTTRKVVIFVDGHSSHILNLEFIEACARCGLDIRIVCLPAGQTNKLQPFDKSVFGPIKKYWRDYLRELTTTVAPEVTKQSFASHLMSNWETFNLESNLKSGFEKTGLFPYDPCVIAMEFDRPPAEPVFEPPVTVTEMYAEKFRIIEDALRAVHTLTERGVAELMEIILRKAEGFMPSISATDIAQKLHDRFMEVHPAKKRQLHDSRLSTKAGVVINRSAFEDALRDRAEEKAQKERTKVRKRKVPVPKAPVSREPSEDAQEVLPKKQARKPAAAKAKPSKRPLSDITNSPPKKRFRSKGSQK